MTARVGSAVEASQLLADADTILFDCDGVLWRGGQVIPGAIETVRALRRLGKRLFFITNNSTKSRHAMQAKFGQLGLAVEVEEVVGSAYLLAVFLKGQTTVSREVYVVGRRGIVEELRLMDIPAFGGPEDDGAEFDFGADLPDRDRPVAAVVVGFDEHFNYTKLAKARHYLARPSCLFIATNTDSSYPDAHLVLPGTGCLVAALQCASQREPIVIGKPSTFAFQALQQAHPEISPARTLMVGDKILTDILFGLACGLTTLLVETGVDCEHDLARYPESQQPHYIASSVRDLYKEGCMIETMRGEAV